MNDILAVDIMRQQLKMKIHAPSPGAYRQTTDSRQAIAPVPAIQLRLAATRCPSATHGRCQEEARFIEKNQVRITLPCRRSNPRKLVLLPLRDRRFIALTSTSLWFLRCPVQAVTQKPADMVVMESHAEVTANEFGDPSAGPQLRGPTVRLGTLQQQSLQATMLRDRQACRRTGMGFRGQAVGFLSKIQPTINRRTMDSQDAGNHFWAISRGNCGNRTAASSFQFRCRSKGSTHMELDEPGYEKIRIGSAAGNRFVSLASQGVDTGRFPT